MKTNRGFTLIEILVAATMLAFLAAAGLAALTTGVSSAAKARRYGAMMAHGQAALQVISSDIRTAVVHEKFHLVALDNTHDGLAADTIDFVAARRPRLVLDESESGGRCEVGYYIENDPDTEIQWLLRREDATLDDDPLEGGSILLAGPFVSELNMEFYDGLFWQSEWENIEQFPEAVYIQIVVVDKDEIENPMQFRTTVPIMAR